jgi:hypothetical protein
MPAVLHPTHTAAPRPPRRAGLNSCDSGEEFSFHHWMEVRRLVDEADIPLKDEGLPYLQKTEEAPEETTSEVESPAAYQHFPGNVV